MTNEGGDAVTVIEADLRERVIDSIGTLLPRVLKRDLAPPPEDTGLFDELGLSSSSTLELLPARQRAGTGT